VNPVVGRLLRDPLERELAPLLRRDIDPRAIVEYGIPAYKRYQLSGQPLLVRRVRKLLSQPARSRLVQSGDYLRLGTFPETETWRFLDQLWRANLDFRSVDRYHEFSRRIAAGETIVLRSKRRRMSNTSELDAYFADYVELMRSMSENGYVATGASDRIMIMIDHHGGIMKETKGRHRLAAAQIAGVRSVPVRISHVHAAWVGAQDGENQLEKTRQAIERAIEAANGPRDQPASSVRSTERASR
jgi:hypothetical protein